MKKILIIFLASLGILNFLWAQSGDQINSNTNDDAQQNMLDEDLGDLENLIDLDDTWLDDSSVNGENQKDEKGNDEVVNKDSKESKVDEKSKLQKETGDEDLDLDIQWGYTDQDEIKVKETGSNYVILEAPVVKDGNGNVIKQYKVYYSTKSLAENIDASQIYSKTFTFDVVTGNVVDLKIDALSSNTKYYFVVVPVNSEDVEWQQSKEVEATTTEPKEVQPQQEPEQHPAPEVEIKNVSYTVSGNKVTLKWSPVNGADKIEIYYKNAADQDYKKLDAVQAKNTSYTFDVAKEGEYLVKLTPVDSNGVPVGKDYILTVKVEKVAKQTPKKAPKVGPEINFLIMLILLASLGYVLVRFKKA